MATFVLIPGAGGHAAYWHRLIPELEARGHRAIAVDIQENDPSMDLDGFAAVVEAAIGDHAELILVAQSLGGFTAPMVRRPVQMIVLLNAMIPLPGESPNDWWGNTGSGAARREADLAAGRDPEFDLERHFLHDVPDAAREELLSGEAREPSAAAMAQPCGFARWPAVPTKVLIGRDDRFFPAEFQRRVAKDRLALNARANSRVFLPSFAVGELIDANGVAAAQSFRRWAKIALWLTRYFPPRQRRSATGCASGSAMT